MSDAQRFPGRSNPSADPSAARVPMTIAFHEAQLLSGLSRNTLYRLLRAKKVPGAQKLGGTWRFHLQTLVEWLACKPLGTPPKLR